MDYGEFSCLFHLSYFISPKQCSQLRGYGEHEGMHLKHPAFSLQVQAKLNSCTLLPSTLLPSVPSTSPCAPPLLSSWNFSHFDCAVRSWGPHPACRHTARLAEIICRYKADFWEAPSSALAGWGLPQNLSGLPPAAQLLQPEVVRYQRLSHKDVPEHK